MDHKGDTGTDQAATDQGHGDSRDDQPPDRDHDLRPRATMPPTVLVTELDNGTLILQGRPDGSRLWLNPADAGPLKRALAAAFGRAWLATLGDDRDEDQAP